MERRIPSEVAHDHRTNDEMLEVDQSNQDLDHPSDCAIGVIPTRWDAPCEEVGYICDPVQGEWVDITRQKAWANYHRNSGRVDESCPHGTVQQAHSRRVANHKKIVRPQAPSVVEGKEEGSSP